MTRVYIIILLSVLVANGIGIFNGSTWDDRYLLPKAQNVSIIDAFLDRTTGSSSGESSYYRPLRTLLFKAVISLPGPNIAYLHFLSIILHFSVVILLFRLCFKISNSKGRSLVCSVLFSVHPITTEAVAGISNIKEILSTLFVLLVLYHLWLIAKGERNNSRTFLLISIFTLLGLLSKETALVIPAVALTMPFIYRNNWRNTLKYATAPALIVTVLYTFLILVLVPGPEKGEYILDSMAITLYTTCAAFIKYFQLVLFPINLSIRHDIQWITTFLDWHVIAVIVVILSLTFLTVYLVVKKDYRAVPLAFFLITLLPISNIVPIRGHIMSERYFYMPLSGIFLTIACLFPKEKCSPRYFVLIIVAIILVLSISSVMRTLKWKDDRTLFESAVRVAPDSLVVRWNLFEIYRKNNEPAKAQAEYREMIRINKEMTYRYVEYARLLQSEGKTQEAERLWDKAEYTASGTPLLLEYVRSKRIKTY